MLIYVKSKRLKQTLSLDMLIIRRKKQYVNFSEWNWIIEIIWTSSGFPTMQDSHQPTQLQSLARMLKYCV